MALLVVASGLYRLMAKRMRGYHDAQARQIFRDLVDMPADVAITVASLRFHRHCHCAACGARRLRGGAFHLRTQSGTLGKAVHCARTSPLGGSALSLAGLPRIVPALSLLYCSRTGPNAGRCRWPKKGAHFAEHGSPML